MLYQKKSEKELSRELFQSPTSEYRGTPFWSWNTNLEKDELLWQIDQLKDMGSLEQIAGMIPGMKAGALKDAKIDEKAMDRTKAIILSMTPREREKPDIINSSRKKRIAAGSGTSVEEINRLLKQFEQMNKLMKQFTGKGSKKFRGMMKMPF